MTAPVQILRPLREGQNAREVERFAADVALIMDRPRASARFTIGAQATLTRPIALQVINRRKYPISARFLLLVWLSTSDGGDPGGTQTVAFTSGTVLETITANQEYRVLTTTAGAAGFDLTLPGTGTRYAEAIVLGQMDKSGAIAFV